MTRRDAQESVLACGFAWAENQVQAALETVSVGQGAGQRILARLRKNCSLWRKLRSL